MRTLQSELVKKGLSNKKPQSNHKKKQTPVPSNNEQFKRWEVEELMGVRRQTYRRGNGGAYRSRGSH